MGKQLPYMNSVVEKIVPIPSLLIRLEDNALPAHEKRMLEGEILQLISYLHRNGPNEIALYYGGMYTQITGHCIYGINSD